MRAKALKAIIVLTSTLILISSITVSAKITNPIKLNKKTVVIKVGRKITLKVKKKIKINWKSSNTKVAAVKKGVVTAKKEGKTNVIAYKGKHKAVCSVKVIKKTGKLTTEQTDKPVTTPSPTEKLAATPEPTAAQTDKPAATPEPTAAQTDKPAATPEPTAAQTDKPITTPTPASPEPTAGIPSGNPEGDYEPGVVLVGLYEPYTGTNFEELFPELEINSVEDMYSKLYEESKDNPQVTEKAKEDLRKLLGKTFNVKLKDETKESVPAAIEIIKKNDLVKYAEPNYIVYPDDDEITDDL